MNAFTRLSISALIVAFAGCDRSASLEPKKRPPGVPSEAVWAGGADGGAYVHCAIDRQNNVDKCTVWNDFTGESVSGDYVLLKEHRAATESELKFTGAAN
jgi:hypothetical protein